MRFPYFIPQHTDPGGGAPVGGGGPPIPDAVQPPAAPAPVPGPPAPEPAAPGPGPAVAGPGPAAEPVPPPAPEPLTADGVAQAVRQALGELLDPYAQGDYGQGDPYAGQPQPPGYDPYAAAPQQPRFDPYTGQPLQPQAPPLPPLDPLDPQTFPQALQAHVGQMLDERFGQIQEAIQPLSGFAQEYAAERGRERASQLFGGVNEQGQLYGLAATVGGAFDHERAMERAARYHYDGMPGPQALERAARDQFEFEKHVRAAAIDEYTRTLGGNAGTPPQPPVGGTPPASPAPGVPTGPNRYVEQLQRSLASMDGRQPPGYG